MSKTKLRVLGVASLLLLTFAATSSVAYAAPCSSWEWSWTAGSSAYCETAASWDCANSTCGDGRSLFASSSCSCYCCADDLN